MTVNINQPSSTLAYTASTSNAPWPVGTQRGAYVFNSGTAIVFVASGNASVVATTSSMPIPPNLGRTFERNSNDTNIAAIGSTTGNIYFHLMSPPSE